MIAIEKFLPRGQ